MKVALGSIFRNSSHYLDRYFRQVTALRDVLRARGHDLRLLLAEGDSTDDTYTRLAGFAAGLDCHLLQVHHGGREYGSVDNKERWQNISLVCNELLACLTDDDDIMIYVESDLIWQVDTMLRLIEHLDVVGVVAPMCFGNNGRFYDVWGHRKDGVCFTKEAPYHRGLTYDGLTEIESAGSCLVMTGEAARLCRFRPEELGIVGWCQDIRQHGYVIWLDGRLKVHHP